MSSIKSPFKFIDAYTQDDGDIFFGRDREVAQLYNAVFAFRHTLLYGASGTGKTSLIQCGLGSKFYDTDWLPLFIRRQQNINISLRNVLHKSLGVSDGSETDLVFLMDSLFKKYYKTIYLIFDQFEELYTEGKKEEQEEFYENIKNILKFDNNLQVKILFVMREEWLGHLNDFERVIPRLFDNRLRLERIRKNLLISRVVPGILRKAEIELVDGVTASDIIGQICDTSTEADLTDLQIYLDRLYQSASGKDDSVLSFDRALLEKVGRIDDVLSVFLSEQLEKLAKKLVSDFGIGSKDANEIANDILFALVTNEKTKRSRTIEEVVGDLQKNKFATKEVVDFCLRELMQMRLLNQID